MVATLLLLNVVSVISKIFLIFGCYEILLHVCSVRWHNICLRYLWSWQIFLQFMLIKFRDFQKEFLLVMNLVIHMEDGNSLIRFGRRLIVKESKPFLWNLMSIFCADAIIPWSLIIIFVEVYLTHHPYQFTCLSMKS